MGHGEDGAGIGRQELLEPLHRFGVQVVGRLVEQQQVGSGQQQLAQRDPAPLAAREDRDRGVAGRAAQRVHGLVDLGVQVPGAGVVEVLLEGAHLLHQRVGVVGRHQLGDLVVPRQLRVDPAERLLDVLQHGLALVQVRFLHEDADAETGVRNASPLLGVSSPAMIFRIVDLPAPLGPTTPIFAPG